MTSISDLDLDSVAREIAAFSDDGKGAESVRKSLPDYWDRLAALGIQAEVEPWNGSAGKIS